MISVILFWMGIIGLIITGVMDYAHWFMSPAGSEIRSSNLYWYPLSFIIASGVHEYFFHS